MSQATARKLTTVNENMAAIIADYQSAADKLAATAHSGQVPTKDDLDAYTELVEQSRAAFRIRDIIQQHSTENAIELLEAYLNGVYSEKGAVPSYTRVVARAYIYVM